MIHLLRAKERTVSQIAEELGKTPQAIYHHIPKMREAGMVEVAREERIDHFIETYYQATAEVFCASSGSPFCPARYISQGEGGKEHAKKEAKEALESLPKMGYDVQIDDKTISELVELQMQMESCGVEFQEKTNELEDVDFYTKQSVGKYAHFLYMSDEEFKDYQRLEREFRKLLRSRLLEKAKA